MFLLWAARTGCAGRFFCRLKPQRSESMSQISVFFPIIFVEGVAGQLFKQQSITVSFSLLVSLLVSLTLLPMLAAHFLSGSYRFSKMEVESKTIKAFKERKLFGKLLFIFTWPFRFAKLCLTDAWELLRLIFRKISDLLNKIFTPVFTRFDLIFGKVVMIEDKKYILRLLSGYSEKKNHKANEWDKYIVNTNKISGLPKISAIDADINSKQESEKKLNGENNKLFCM